MENKNFDVIIIGAGIGGLICGCFLSKAGQKTLIIEKNSKAGGYCTSFEKCGYRFDVGVHGFGGLCQDGKFLKILEDLDLKDELGLVRLNPSDIIVFDKFRINFWNDTKRTVDELKNIFKREARSITSFYDFILNNNYLNLYYKVKDMTFLQFLGLYFKNAYLIKLFCIPLGNLGVSADILSAAAGIALYKEFLINGGFYPAEGVEKLPIILKNKFLELGGKLLLSTEVVKIDVRYGKARGVTTEKNECISTRCVVSNSDCLRTFSSLISCDNSAILNYRKKLGSFTFSPAAFVLYLGLKQNFQNPLLKGNALWYFPSYEKNIYLHNRNPNDIFYMSNCVFCSSSNLYKNFNQSNKSVHLLIMAPFFSERFWKIHKEFLANNLIKRLSNLIPSFSDNITFQAISSPYDFYRYTYNHRGASYGWAATLGQTREGCVSFKTPIENLFLCGHWITTEFGQGGVSTVACNGLLIANHVLRYLTTHQVL